MIGFFGFKGAHVAHEVSQPSLTEKAPELSPDCEEFVLLLF
jgi:hypothetical protein